jgi:hypothetical protein
MSLTCNAVRRLGLALPGVEESTSYGTPALKVNGRLMTRLWEDGRTLVMKTTFEERDALMAEAPETYYVTDHYLDYPWVLIRLPKADAGAVNDLLHAAHRIASSEKRRSRKKGARKARVSR